jgi:ring-1,2-phenylacetyl-CoA epoxidase subunit PaaD
MNGKMRNADLNINVPEETRKIRQILSEVMDPEVPVISVIDLGIIRNIIFLENEEKGEWVITITPTYSGCPAMDVIRVNIRIAMISHGYDNVKVQQVLSPAWTTDWMSDEGKEKLRAYGIAPPNPIQQVCKTDLFIADEAVQCPHCKSHHTKRISEFGSTPCKSLFQCEECNEPFDYFKCH